MGTKSDAESIKVWDILIRTFHWSLVLFFTIAYVTGDELDTVHAWSGYIIIGLLAVRLVWGMIGTRYARFSNFIYSPQKITNYLKSLFTGRPEHYLGHNPAGGAMVVVMLIFLILSSWSGLKAYEAEGKGPLASSGISLVSPAQADSWYDKEHKHGKGGKGDEFWEEAHEVFVNFTLLLVFIHIGGVLASSLLHRENLVRAMITGRKKKQDEDQARLNAAGR
ncbi:MAG: cytochrome b/b6 domain-containing protein [Mariprofundaceae bacterium]|nr:cytochrome b/b6 domain-containing protein [Mariprofundaceae bacterium]